ncbi:MAG: endonuclease III [Candidatus Obscuribacterales bacterium]|nr:endonuclease III [Candidatus Obscuribacterales bacterium]
MPEKAKKAASKAVKTESKNSGKANPKKASNNESKKKLVSKTTAAEMMAGLCKLYPDADCELTFKNDFELLTAVIMSAQTTDVQVNKVTPELFRRFPTPKALAEANPDDVKEIIKATGYYNNKAKSIQSCAKDLVERFGGKVPKTLEDLTTLPGVGRKTANVVLGVVHKIPGWTVDTHVQRLSKRLGLSKNEDPYKIELDLQKLFPEQDWTKYSITLIWHGRRLCYARNPDCNACPLNNICPSSMAP